MNDNDIIKALECCTSGTTSEACNGCPLFSTTICTEMENGLQIYTLDLINRQKAEIERLRKANNDLSCQVNACNPTQTIKDFAVYLCDGRVSNDPVVIAVKCAVQEMTEDKE